MGGAETAAGPATGGTATGGAATAAAGITGGAELGGTEGMGATSAPAVVARDRASPCAEMTSD